MVAYFSLVMLSVKDRFGAVEELHLSRIEVLPGNYDEEMGKMKLNVCARPCLRGYILETKGDVRTQRSKEGSKKVGSLYVRGFDIVGVLERVSWKGMR